MHDIGLRDVTGRLRIGRLVREALSLVARTARPLSVVWLAMLAINLTSALIEFQAPVEEGARITIGVGEALAIGVCSMAAVRTMLGAPDVWRLDRGGLAFAAVDVASSLALMGWYGVAPPLDSHLAAFKVALWVAGGLAVWWVFIRIALWTYAQALRQRGVTFDVSWRRMSGAAGAIIGASAILAILPGQGIELVTQLSRDSGGDAIARLALALLNAAGSAAYSVMIVAIPAAVYELRGGADNDALAKIFD